MSTADSVNELMSLSNRHSSSPLSSSKLKTPPRENDKSSSSPLFIFSMEYDIYFVSAVIKVFFDQFENEDPATHLSLSKLWSQVTTEFHHECSLNNKTFTGCFNTRAVQAYCFRLLLEADIFINDQLSGLTNDQFQKHLINTTDRTKSLIRLWAKVLNNDLANNQKVWFRFPDEKKFRTITIKWDQNDENHEFNIQNAYIRAMAKKLEKYLPPINYTLSVPESKDWRVRRIIADKNGKTFEELYEKKHQHNVKNGKATNRNNVNDEVTTEDKSKFDSTNINDNTSPKDTSNINTNITMTIDPNNKRTSISTYVSNNSLDSPRASLVPDNVSKRAGNEPFSHLPQISAPVLEMEPIETRVRHHSFSSQNESIHHTAKRQRLASETASPLSSYVIHNQGQPELPTTFANNTTISPRSISAALSSLSNTNNNNNNATLSSESPTRNGSISVAKSKRGRGRGRPRKSTSSISIPNSVAPNFIPNSNSQYINITPNKVTRGTPAAELASSRNNMNNIKLQSRQSSIITNQFSPARPRTDSITLQQDIPDRLLSANGKHQNQNRHNDQTISISGRGPKLFVFNESYNFIFTRLVYLTFFSSNSNENERNLVDHMKLWEKVIQDFRITCADSAMPIVGDISPLSARSYLYQLLYGFDLEITEKSPSKILADKFLFQADQKSNDLWRIWSILQEDGIIRFKNTWLKLNGEDEFENVGILQSKHPGSYNISEVSGYIRFIAKNLERYLPPMDFKFDKRPRDMWKPGKRFLKRKTDGDQLASEQSYLFTFSQEYDVIFVDFILQNFFNLFPPDLDRYQVMDLWSRTIYDFRIQCKKLGKPIKGFISHVAARAYCFRLLLEADIIENEELVGMTPEERKVIYFTERDLRLLQLREKLLEASYTNPNISSCWFWYHDEGNYKTIQLRWNDQTYPAFPRQSACIRSIAKHLEPYLPPINYPFGRTQSFKWEVRRVLQTIQGEFVEEYLNEVSPNNRFTI